MTIVQERLDALATLTLKNGSHPSPDDGLCVMEAAAWVAGEPHSDHPACVRLQASALVLLDRMIDPAGA